jgi:hypothetical protein
LLPLVRRHLRESISGIEAGGLDAYLADAFPLYVAPGRIDDRALWGTFAAMGKSLDSPVRRAADKGAAGVSRI